VSHHAQRVAAARQAKAQAEAALDASGGRWSLRLSRWLDALLVLIEGRAA
jgi:hypothetical protein